MYYHNKYNTDNMHTAGPTCYKKKFDHLQELLALAEAVTTVVTRYTTSDPKTPTLFN